MYCPKNIFNAFLYLESWQRSVAVGGITGVTVLTLLSNVVVILSIFRTKQQNHVTCIFTLCLSVSDCLIAVTCQSLIIVIILRPNVNCNFQVVTQFFACLFIGLSGFIILAVGIERAVHINNFQLPSQDTTKKRAWRICIACVVAAFVFSLTCVMVTSLGLYSIFHHLMTAFLLISHLAELLSYLVLYQKVCRHVKTTSNLREMNNVKRFEGKDKPFYLSSMAKVIKRILTTQIITYAPFGMTILFWDYGKKAFCPKCTKWIAFLVLLSYLLAYFKTTINAVIFIVGNKKSKRFIKLTLKREALSADEH